MLNMLAAALYAVFVLALTLPGRFGSRREVFAYALGAAAALFVPVSGAAPFPASTRWFFPLAVGSALAGGRGRAGLPFAVALALFVLAVDTYAVFAGIPGERFSIEPAAMISRILALRPEAEFALAAAAEACLLAVCGAALRTASRGAGCCRGVLFAFASFAATVMIPADSAALLGVSFPISAIADLAVMMAVSLTLYRALAGGQTVRAEHRGDVPQESSISSRGMAS